MKNELSTLQHAITYFADPTNCRNYVVERRWPNGVICPTCGSTNVKFSEKHNRWQCGSHHPKRQFTVKTGTIFEESPLGLDRWLCAMWLIVNCKNGVSSYEIHRDLGVTQKTAVVRLLEDVSGRLQLVIQRNRLAEFGFYNQNSFALHGTAGGSRARFALQGSRLFSRKLRLFLQVEFRNCRGENKGPPPQKCPPLFI